MLGFYNYTVILTYLGLISGISGIFFAFRGQPDIAVICLLQAGCFDMFDGKVASTRKRTEQERKFGIQIDSLSDLICFGVLPVAIGYAVGLKALWYIPLACLYVLAALIRLAYFNVMEEERQKTTAARRKSYNGMPVTLVSGFLPLLYCFQDALNRLHASLFSYVYLGVMLLFGSAFLITHLKIRKISFKEMLWVAGIGAVLLAALVLKALLKRFL